VRPSSKVATLVSVGRATGRQRNGVLAATVAALAVRNVSGPWLPAAAYVPLNLTIGAALVGLARWSGTTWGELGLARDRLPFSLRLGALVGGAAAAVMAVGALVRTTRGFFEDGRVDVGLGGGELAYQTLVRIPLGTVVFEEVAFRDVLLALLCQRMGTRSAVLVYSVLFGLWHIVPTLGAANTNEITGLAQAGTVVGAVVVTAVGGVVFCWLRLRSGHVVAPVLLHLAFNVTGYSLSWWVQS
jgi:membrane protease YdiL (CAAX protease family)